MAFATLVRRRPHPWRWLRRARIPIVRWLLVAGLASMVAFVVGMLTAPVDLTPPAPASQSAVLLDANGDYFATIRAPEIRSEIAESEMPLHLRQAIVAAEDSRFLEHKGVDPLAIVRAAYRDLRAKEVRQGGSTITQQYVKNLYVGSDRTALRKIREAALAYRLEQEKSKQEILTAYLNTLYLGNGTYGVEAASYYYFEKKTRNLTLAEAALLVGIAPAPSRYNPVRDFVTAKQRQFYVLNRMQIEGYISASQASAAYQEPIRIKKKQPGQLGTVAPEVADQVREELTAQIGEDRLFREGVRVRTTMELPLQLAAQAAATDILTKPDDPNVAIVVIDPKNGDLKAVYSSGYTRGGFSNGLNANRSPGSVMKIFNLAAALKEGIGESDRFSNPRVFRYGRGKDDVAQNYEQSGGGSITLRRAAEVSSNTVFVQIGQKIGVDTIVATAKAMGAEGKFDPQNGPTMVIGGGVDITPLSVVRGLGVVANGGVLNRTRYIREIRAGGDPDDPLSGELLVPAAEDKPAGTRVLPQTVADTEKDILKGVVTRGTGRAARQPFVVFGKTGTSSNNTDAWFVGCGIGTPEQELCVAVWMGYAKGLIPMKNIQGVKGVTGGSLPARIFSQFWKRAAEFRAAAAATAAGEPVVPAASRSPRPTSAPPTAEPTSGPTVAPSPTAAQTSGPPHPFETSSAPSPSPSSGSSTFGPPTPPADDP